MLETMNKNDILQNEIHDLKAKITKLANIVTDTNSRLVFYMNKNEILKNELKEVKTLTDGNNKNKNKTMKNNKKEKGCTEPLYGKKSKCIIKIVPQEEKCKTMQIDKKCIKRRD